MPKTAAFIWERMTARMYSHVELSQQLVDRQQAGNILDNNFPSSFDRSVVGICPLSFAFPPPWFLQNEWQCVTGEEDSGLLGTGNKALGSGIMQAAPKTCLSEGSVLPWKTSMTCPGEQASPSVGSEKQVKAASSRSNSLKKYFVSFPVKANNRINQHRDANQTWASLAGGPFNSHSLGTLCR